MKPSATAARLRRVISSNGVLQGRMDVLADSRITGSRYVALQHVVSVSDYEDETDTRLKPFSGSSGGQ